MNKVLLNIQDFELLKNTILKYEELHGINNTFKHRIINDSLVELIYPSFSKLYELGSSYGTHLFYKYNIIELGEKKLKINKCIFDSENISNSWDKTVDIELSNGRLIKFKLINLSLADSSQLYRPFKLMSENDIEIVETFVGISKSDYTDLSHPISYQIIMDNLLFFKTEYPSRIFLDSIFEVKWKMRTTLLG
jgi:hypothetical protein